MAVEAVWQNPAPAGGYETRPLGRAEFPDTPAGGQAALRWADALFEQHAATRPDGWVPAIRTDA